MSLTEITEENPYPSKFLNYLDYISIQGMRLFKIPLDVTLSCLFLTTSEKKFWYYYIYRWLFILPAGLFFVLLTLPINIAAFLLWLTIHRQRKPYRLSYCGASRKAIGSAKLKRCYGFLTTNVCLMPECMGRYNNFKNSAARAHMMGEILGKKRQSISSVIEMEEGAVDNNHNRSTAKRPLGNVLLDNGYSVVESIKDRTWRSLVVGQPKPGRLPEFDVSVLSHLPDVDFVLLQEASWDMEFAKILVREMHAAYPYVVYDIGMHSLRGNLWVGNSGLMLASRYDILDIRFGLFEKALLPCWFASKGLLQLKVYLGRNESGQDVVGYVFNTHLQAYKGRESIQSLQMNSILKWTEEFKKETYKPGEIVAFDLLGGDFNLDNMSPVDRDVYTHDLFKTYIDVGREREGKDHYWAKGTELRQVMIHDPEISSPAGLKKVLEDPILMQKFVLNGDINYASVAMATMKASCDAEGKIIQSPVGGKRRIDYLLIHTEEKHVKVKSFNPVTCLYNLTDHIPVYMSLDVSSHNELRDAFEN